MSERIVVESRKWYAEAKNLVHNYEFNLKYVYDNTMLFHREIDVVHNCDFCGQAIRYVALIDGLPKLIKSHHPVTRQIGCDCLGRVLGTTWKHYSSAMGQYKKLVTEAQKTSRKAKYAEKYAKEIKWIENLPPFLMNRFLKDTIALLTTGDKVITPGREKYLMWHINNPKWNDKAIISNYNQSIIQKEKLVTLLALIEKKDGKNIHTKYSAYEFVNSVLNSIDRQNGLTPNQMVALNKVAAKYKTPITNNPNRIVADMNDVSIPY